MEQDFEAQAYEAACILMGEAIWQLIDSGHTVSQEAIARMIVELSEKRANLVSSIALAVLND